MYKLDSTLDAPPLKCYFMVLYRLCCAGALEDTHLYRRNTYAVQITEAWKSLRMQVGFQQCCRLLGYLNMWAIPVPNLGRLTLAHMDGYIGIYVCTVKVFQTLKAMVRIL